MMFELGRGSSRPRAETARGKNAQSFCLSSMLRRIERFSVDEFDSSGCSTIKILT
jgi:hypothetical protein